jgi:hypothetical protein
MFPNTYIIDLGSDSILMTFSIETFIEGIEVSSFHTRKYCV